jgi:hypothetical protein
MAGTACGRDLEGRRVIQRRRRTTPPYPRGTGASQGGTFEFVDGLNCVIRPPRQRQDHRAELTRYGLGAMPDDG